MWFFAVFEWFFATFSSFWDKNAKPPKAGKPAKVKVGKLHLRRIGMEIRTAI